MAGISTRQIGDGKLPNKYWVSISDDYYYMAEPGTFDWASDHGVVKSPKAATIKVFDSYNAAKRFVDGELYLGGKHDGITINSIMIEDRLSGQVFERIKYFDPDGSKIWEDEHEDLGFSREREAELRASRKAASSSKPGGSRKPKKAPVSPVSVRRVSR